MLKFIQFEGGFFKFIYLQANPQNPREAAWHMWTMVDETFAGPTAYFTKCLADEPPPVKGQEQKVLSENYFYSSTCVLIADEVNLVIMFIFALCFFMCDHLKISLI